MFSIFISRFDSNEAHPQQIYKEVQFRKTLRNLGTEPTGASRSSAKKHKKYCIGDEVTPCVSRAGRQLAEEQPC